MIAYYNGQFLPKEQIHVSPDDRGFQFADGVYEVMRSYGGRLFRAVDHFARLQKSLQGIRLSLPDLETIHQAAKKLILENHLAEGDALVYIQITRGAAPRKHAFPDDITPTVYVTVTPFQPYPETYQDGVHVVLVPDTRWSRCDIKSVALLPNVLAMQEAKEKEAQEAVFVRDGIVMEGSHTSICAVLNDLLVTHPLDNRILPSVTRKVVLELCQELGILYEESPIPAYLLKDASEIMILSTTKEIMPVIQVDDWTVGHGTPGPMVASLKQAFRALVG